jgi:hypothetical protein
MDKRAILQIQHEIEKIDPKYIIYPATLILINSYFGIPGVLVFLALNKNI